MEELSEDARTKLAEIERLARELKIVHFRFRVLDDGRLALSVQHEGELPEDTFGPSLVVCVEKLMKRAASAIER